MWVLERSVVKQVLKTFSGYSRHYIPGGIFQYKGLRGQFDPLMLTTNHGNSLAQLFFILLVWQ